MGSGHTAEDYLSALAGLQAQLGLPPTLRELADELGMASAPAVLGRLRELRECGYVERRTEDAYATRVWRVSKKGRRKLKRSELEK